MVVTLESGGCTTTTMRDLGNMTEVWNYAGRYDGVVCVWAEPHTQYTSRTVAKNNIIGMERKWERRQTKMGTPKAGMEWMERETKQDMGLVRQFSFHCLYRYGPRRRRIAAAVAAIAIEHKHNPDEVSARILCVCALRLLRS